MRRVDGARPVGVRGGSLDLTVRLGAETLPARTGLLERHEEMGVVGAVIDKLCENSHSGRDTVLPGELIVVESEAGWGKTTILEEARRIAVSRHCTVLRAKGVEREQARSFSIVRQLFLGLLRRCSEDERAELLGDWYDIVAPAIGLCPAAAGSRPDPFGVRDALDWLMTGLTQRHGPVVLLIDDAHWADAESMQWLAGFACNLEHWPVLLMVARRTEELTDVHDLLRELSSLDRAHRMRLARLSANAVSSVVEAVLGPGDAAFVERCREVTGGSNFVLWATLKEFRRRGLAPVGANALQVAEIAAEQIGPRLASRLEGMGEKTIAVACAVAVLGSDASPVRVAALADIPVTEVGGIADRLRAAAILVNDDVLGFVHPLIATAVYQFIAPSARSALHARAARLLVTDGRDARSAAVHLLATEPCGDPWVVEQLRLAADQDKKAGAPHSALRCLQRAMNEPPRREERAAVQYELGRAWFVSSPEQAITHLRAALAEEQNDRVLRESIVLHLARTLGYIDRVAEAVELLDTEAQAVHSVTTRLRLQAEHFLWAVWWVDDPDYHARARRLKNLVVRLEGKNRTERCLLALRAWYGVVRGDPMVQVLASADQAWGPGLTWTDEEWGFEIPSLLALTYMYCDRNDRAEELFTDGIRELRAHGWLGTHLSYAYSLRSFVRYRQGKLALAEEDCRDGLRLALRLGPLAPARWYPLSVLIEVLIARGRVDEAVRLAEAHSFTEPFANAVVTPVPQAVRGELRLAKHLLPEAESDFVEAGEKLERRGVTNPAWCPWRLHLAMTLAQRDPEAAYEHASEALRRAYRFGAPSAMGQALRVVGRLEGGHKGIAKIEDALMWLEHSDARYEYALTLVEYGKVLRREFGDRDAVDPLFEGLTVAVGCGADALAEAARAELVAMGQLPPSLMLGHGPEE